MAELAEALLREDCRLVLHVDRSVSDAEYKTLRARIANDRVAYAERRDCEWGRFSLVEATCTSAELAFKTWPEATHACLLSGSCLPIKPVADFLTMLQAEPGTDFIESVSATSGAWVKSGLSEERFTLWFPFSWQKQRWLFDRAVNLQRSLGIRRKLPDGLTPHLGSQWWCLSRATLEAILSDPMRAEYDRFFKHTWIPDESYFQSLVRKHGLNITQQPPTFARFDADGQPLMFYDEHAGYLAGVDTYFVRKIWVGADELYQRFLNGESVEPAQGLIAELDALEHRRKNGRKGVLSAGRFPKNASEIQYIAAAPYAVFIGFDCIVSDMRDWLNSSPGAICHGRLYHPEQVELAGYVTVTKGNIPANPAIRDNNQAQYLMNLIRASQPAYQGFALEIEDSKWMLKHIAYDPGAEIICLRDQWLFSAYHAWKEAPETLATTIRDLQHQEAQALASLLSPNARCTLVEVSLAEIFEHKSNFASIIAEATAFKPTQEPPLEALPDGFEDFLKEVKLLT